MNKPSNIWISARATEFQGMCAERDSANIVLVRLCKLIDGNQGEEWFDKFSEAINQIHDGLSIMNNEIEELENQLPGDHETGAMA